MFCRRKEEKNVFLDWYLEILVFYQISPVPPATESMGFTLSLTEDGRPEEEWKFFCLILDVEIYTVQNTW